LVSKAKETAVMCDPQDLRIAASGGGTCSQRGGKKQIPFFVFI